MYQDAEAQHSAQSGREYQAAYKISPQSGREHQSAGQLASAAGRQGYRSEGNYSRSYRREYPERRNQKSQPRKTGNKNIIRLITCTAVLIAAIAAKSFFPEKVAEYAETILPMMENNFDYKAVAQTLGETISGEQTITQAMGEIYVIAFGGGKGEDLKVDQDGAQTQLTPALTPLQQLHEGAARILTQRVSPQPQQVPDQEGGTEETREQETQQAENNQTAETTNTVVEAFLLNQQQFSDYDLPTNVTYEMPELGITYGCPRAGTVSSSFGYRSHPMQNTVSFHYGTDIAADTGDAVVAFANGTVIAVADSVSSGLNVSISHDNGVVSRYAHCNEIYVSEGDTVNMGDKIAAAGATGNATGPHLHFELSVNGMYVNPEYYLNFAYA